MTWLDTLKRKFRNFYIPNLMIYIAAGMFFVFLVDFIGVFPVVITDWISFDRSAILAGEVWRIITFIFNPIDFTPFFILLSLYFMVFIGKSLEGQWGAPSFTLYYLVGVVGAIISGFITGTTSNVFLNTSLFLATAALFPNLEVLLFFFISVKYKYIGYATWIVYGISLIVLLFSLDFPGILALLFSLINYFIFFGPTIWKNFKHKRKYKDLRKEFKKNRDMW